MNIARIIVLVYVLLHVVVAMQHRGVNDVSSQVTLSAAATSITSTLNSIEAQRRAAANTARESQLFLASQPNNTNLTPKSAAAYDIKEKTAVEQCIAATLSSAQQTKHNIELLEHQVGELEKAIDGLKAANSIDAQQLSGEAHIAGEMAAAQTGAADQLIAQLRNVGRRANMHAQNNVRRWATQAEKLQQIKLEEHKRAVSQDIARQIHMKQKLDQAITTAANMIGNEQAALDGLSE